MKSKQKIAAEMADEFAQWKFPIQAGAVYMTPAFDSRSVPILVEALRLYASTKTVRRTLKPRTRSRT